MSEALYRKFRPKTFDEIIGQDHITTILKNQIQLSRLSHAYLFTGTRGTGKTSLAKVFARAINCLNSKDAEPCNECENCLEAMSGKAVDIIELDAASNNSVDNIRELRDKAIYMPAKLKYKVYIIDEVHMLSKGAFNALLKILEEPPKHLIFILATTEPERIPKTIISRVQRFDFKRIDETLIAKNLKNILQKVGKDYEDEAVSVVARAGAGSMRDALSMLESAMSYSEVLTKDSVLKALGILDESYSMGIVQAIFKRDIKSYFANLDKLFLDGKDEAMIIDGVIKALRDVLYDKSSGTDKYKFTFDIKLMDIISAIDIYMDYLERMKFVKEKRIFVEMAGLKVISLDSDVMKMNFDRSISYESLDKARVEAKATKPVESDYDDGYGDLASLELGMVDYEDEGFFFNEDSNHEKEVETNVEDKSREEKVSQEEKEVKKEKVLPQENLSYEEDDAVEDSVSEKADENEADKTIGVAADADEASQDDYEAELEKYNKFLADDEMLVMKTFFADLEFVKVLSGMLVLKKAKDISLDTSISLIKMNKDAILEVVNKYYNNIVDIKVESSDEEKRTLKLREDLKEFLGSKLIIK